RTSLRGADRTGAGPGRNRPGAAAVVRTGDPRRGTADPGTCPRPRAAVRVGRPARVRRPVRAARPLLAAELPRLPHQPGAVLDRLADVRPPRGGVLPGRLGFLAGGRAGRGGLDAARRRRAVRPPAGLADPAAVLGRAGVQPDRRVDDRAAAALRVAD